MGDPGAGLASELPTLDKSTHLMDDDPFISTVPQAMTSGLFASTHDSKVDSSFSQQDGDPTYNLLPTPADQNDILQQPSIEAVSEGSKATKAGTRKRKRPDLTINLDCQVPEPAKKGRRGRRKKTVPQETEPAVVPDGDEECPVTLAVAEQEQSTYQHQPLAPAIDYTLNVDPVNEHSIPFRFSHADLTITSSDGFRFLVHQAIIGPSSPKLYQWIYEQRMRNPTSHPAFNCLHPLFETSQTISLFLRVIYNFPLPLITFTNCRIFSFTVWFMRHHGCEAAEAKLRQQLRQIPMEPDQKLSPLLVFLTGAMMFDVEICARAIRHGQGWVFGDPNKALEDGPAEGEVKEHVDNVLNIDENLYGYSVLDPTAWGASLLVDIPPRYLGMMSRLVVKFGFHPGMNKWEEAAEAFRQGLAEKLQAS